MKKLVAVLCALAMLCVSFCALAETQAVTYESRGIEVHATLVTPDGASSRTYASSAVSAGAPGTVPSTATTRSSAVAGATPFRASVETGAGTNKSRTAKIDNNIFNQLSPFIRRQPCDPPRAAFARGCTG